MMHLAARVQQFGDEDPVDDMPVIGEAMRNRRRVSGQSHCIQEAGVTESRGGSTLARAEIEIPSDHNSRLIDITTAVFQDLVQLPETQFVVASAFQVKVVTDYLAAGNDSLCYESDPAAFPSLKNRDVRHIPSRLPE